MYYFVKSGCIPGCIPDILTKKYYIEYSILKITVSEKSYNEEDSYDIIPYSKEEIVKNVSMSYEDSLVYKLLEKNDEIKVLK